MRILVVTPELPYPPDQGGRIRMLQIIKGLAANHEVHLVSNVFSPLSDEENREIAACCQSVSYVVKPYSLWRSIWRLGKSLLVRKPYILSKYYSVRLSRLVQTAVTKLNPDCIIFESQYLIECTQNIDVPVIVDFHDIASQLYESFAADPNFSLKKIHGKIQRRFIHQLERDLPHQVAACTVVSETDQQYLQVLSGARNIFVAPNGVDLDYFNPHLDYLYAGYESDFIFVGSMDYYPNHDAALFFSKEVMPLIWENEADLTFTIVGRNPSPAVLGLQVDKRIRVTDTVKDVRPYLRAATIVVIPIRMGAGSRIKVLEAAAMSKPIVATPIGLEGIDFRHQEHALIANDPAQLAAGCWELVQNPQTRAELGHNAQMAVQAAYSWENCVNCLIETAQKVTAMPTKNQNSGIIYPCE